MKVALVTHNVERGAGQARVNYELVRHCLRSGLEVHVVSETLSPELVQTGATWHPIKPRLVRPDLIHCMAFTPRARKAVGRLSGRVDVVAGNGAVLRVPHAVNICHFVHGAWLRSGMHDSHTSRRPRRWYQAIYSRCNARWERQAFDAAETVVAVSARVRDELARVGVAEPKIRVIVNGVDPEEFRPGEESRAHLGLPERSPLALFVGNIRTPRKNLDGVLRAMRKIPEIHLIVVGDARESPFPGMAAKLGIGERVHFLGYRRDIPQLMRACDIFVFPSRYEACSLALLEALASGLPVVTAVTAGGSELVTEECGHVLSDPEDLDGLVAGIRRFLAPAALTKARLAARYVAEEHSWRRMGEQYVQLFEECTSRRTPISALGVRV